jgi:hypothetical protein
MSEHWPEFGSDQSNNQPEAIGSSSGNGAHREDAVGVAEGSPGDPVAAESETADESPAVAELTQESAVAEASDDAVVTDDATATAAEPAAVDDTAAAVAASPDHGTDIAATDDAGSEFLTELARAMQATAGAQRVRIGEDTERRRQAHIDMVRAREASEADRMRELAAEDMKAIEAWADGERKRIQLERHRRATELHEDLDLSLAEHRSKIDREIEGVERAIAAYRAEVEAFFDGLEGETDVVLIAQHAAWRPVFPTLDAVADAFDVPAADAVEAERPTEEAPKDAPRSGSDGDGAGGAGAGGSEPPVVGVMDPQAQAQAEPAESWSATPEASPEPAPGEASGDAEQTGDTQKPAEPVAATAGASHNAVSSLFESVQVLRPMAWLRREANGGDRSNH